MIELTEKQVELIEQRLESSGVSFYDVKQSLLDHICCTIESKIEYGKNFSDAFEESFLAFGKHGLLRIQLETIEMLNQKQNPMKQLTFISGISASTLIVLGSAFKIQHWPGANLMIILGIFMLITVFLPSIFIYRYKLEFSKVGKISQLVGLATISTFLSGVLFKMMHWPFADLLTITGIISSIFLYFPLLVYKNTLEKSTVARNKYVIVAFTLSIATLMLTSLKDPSKDYISGYASTNQNLEEIITGINRQEQKLITQKELDAHTASRVKELNKHFELIEEIKVFLKAEAFASESSEIAGENIEDSHKLLFYQPIKTLIDDDSQENKLRELFIYLSNENLISDKNTDEFIASQFKHKTLITAYTNLSSLQLKIKQKVLEELLNA
jgi:hypothetical protein